MYIFITFFENLNSKLHAISKSANYSITFLPVSIDPHHTVVLLSEDISLRTKAVVSDIKALQQTVSRAELRI